MYKPFKPPMLKRAPAKPTSVDLTQVPDTDSEEEEEEPIRPAKKRRLLVHVVEDSPPKPKIQSSSAVGAPRKPLLVKSTNEPKPASAASSQNPEGYYMVLW